MRRRRRTPELPGPAGVLVVDKPRGWTSHDVVDAARKWLGTRRVGHLGTLDPMATGVLPLVVREATKLVPFLEGGGKTYAGTIRLGEATDTLDAEGRVLRSHDGPFPDEETIRNALAGFCGEIDQIPPMFSAVKQGGVPLHKKARAGQEVERAAKRVRIDRIDILEVVPPDVEFELDCSPGTYVRVVAADLGERLGCGAHLAALRRTRSGAFGVEQAVPVERLSEASVSKTLDTHLIPPVIALGMPVVRLSAEEARQVAHGGEVATSPVEETGGRVAGLAPNGELLAILEVKPGRRLQPIRVLTSLATNR